MNKGITLVALVITIIVMLILVTVSIDFAIKSDLINRTKITSFYYEMEQLEERKSNKLIAQTITKYTDSEVDATNNFSFTYRKLTNEEIKNLDETLKAEIIYVRNSMGGGEAYYKTKQIWKNNLFECQDIYNNENSLNELSRYIYYIDDGEMKNKYIYDEYTDTCYKIANTKIGKYIVHSLKYTRYVINKVYIPDIKIIEDESGICIASDGTKYYEPNFNNFGAKSYVVYYSQDFTREYTMLVTDYIEKGKPKTKEIEGVTYTFADYKEEGQNIWGNVKCVANGIISYWVWIPRYAYKIENDVESGTNIKTIFINTENKQFDGTDLPDGYTVHPSFIQKEGLKGIWFSKYTPSKVETNPIDESEGLAPDLSKFSPNDTKLIYYTADGNSSIEVDYTENPSQTIQKKGVTYYFYNDEKHIWANVKTIANEIVSYWVWIPRYAYRITAEEIRVIYIDENNAPIDKETYGNIIPEEYTVHPAFTQKEGLRGIWFSKYTPSKKEIEEN